MPYVGRCAAISQVLSTLAELAKSQIGSSNCIKCVVAEDGVHSDMFQCSAHLLRNLDIEHPVYNVLNSVVQSHHATHGNCCKTLLVMSWLWYQEMEQLVDFGLSIRDIGTVFEVGLEAAIDYLMRSSAVRHLNDDLSVTSVDEISRDYSESFEHEREDVLRCPEKDVSPVASDSFRCVNKFDSFAIDSRQSLAEEEDVGWFFEKESKDQRLSDDYDAEKIVFTENVDSDFVVESTRLSSEGCTVLRDSDYLTEKLDDSRICSSDSNNAGLFQCLETEDDEFDDCFHDVVFGLKESETRLAVSNLHQVSETRCHTERKCCDDVSSQGSANLVLLNECLSVEMYPKKVDSNSKTTQEFYSQCSCAGNSASCGGDCRVISRDRTEKLLNCENLVKYENVLDKTEDFDFGNTVKFPTEHSDLIEKDSQATSDAVHEESRHVRSKCILIAERPDCHFDARVLVEPDCLSLAQEIASNAPNISPASTQGQPTHTSSFNFYNPYSRHSLLSLNPEKSIKHHSAQNEQNSNGEFQHRLISGQNSLVLRANSSDGDCLMAFDDKSRNAVDNDRFKSDGSGILAAVETKNCETRVGNDCFEQIDAFRIEKEGLSMGKVTLCDSAMESGDAQTCDSFDPLNTKSRLDHDTSLYDVAQDGGENTFCQDKSCESVFEQRLATLGSNLSHGANDMMKLVVKMAHRQLRDSGSTRFELDLLHTCCLDGVSEGKTCIVDGLLIPISVDQSHLIGREYDSKKPRRALLVHGDVTATFCHQGYRKVTKVTHIRKTVSETESRSETWLNQIMKVIEQLDVGVLFVKGRVDESILYECLHRGVVVFEGVSYRALSALSLCTSAPLNLYVGDCTECCVAQGVELQLWTCEWMKKKESRKHYIYVAVKVLSSPLPVQTAVVCHPVSPVTRVREEQLLHCAHRLCSALTTRKVLVGGGTAETVCALFLEQAADDLEKLHPCETDLVTAAIYRSISRGFRWFVDIVRESVDNSVLGFDSAATRMIYDDCESKLETWRSASCLVSLLLRTDMEIVVRTPRPSQELVIGYL